jgi:hypothetical protein
MNLLQNDEYAGGIHWYVTIESFSSDRFLQTRSDRYDADKYTNNKHSQETCRKN